MNSLVCKILIRDYSKHGRLPLEGIKAIEGNIQKRAEAVLEMSLIGCIQPGNFGVATGFCSSIF